MYNEEHRFTSGFSVASKRYSHNTYDYRLILRRTTDTLPNSISFYFHFFSFKLSGRFAVTGFLPLILNAERAQHSRNLAVVSGASESNYAA